MTCFHSLTATNDTSIPKRELVEQNEIKCLNECYVSDKELSIY